jgi:parallel beta-helix repeat protein
VCSGTSKVRIELKTKRFSVALIALLASGFVFGLMLTSLLPVAAQETASPPVIYVSPSGSDSFGTGTSASPYATISKAVFSAPSTGAVVIVKAGTYSEMVNITKPITLESESLQPSNTIVDATGKFSGIYVMGSGSAGTVIEGLTVTNADNHGIFVQDSSKVTIAHNDVLHNGLNPATCPEPPTPPSGPCISENKAIELVGTSFSSVVANVVMNNQADGGIGVSDDGNINPGALTAGTENPAVGNVVTGNTLIANVGGCGVVVAAYNPGQGVRNNVVTNNYVVNGNAGIVVAADVPQTVAANNTVAYNTVLNNQIPGIIVHSNTPGDIVSGTNVIGNTVSGNGGFGPQPTGITVIGEVEQVLDTTVSGNIVHNEYYGIAIQNATSTTILGNNIDSTVTVPVFGASPSSQMTTTMTSTLTSMESSQSTGTWLLIVGSILLSVVAVIAAAVALLRPKAK